MSEEIIKVLDSLTERFGIAIDWSSSNVMPYLEELFGKVVNYKITTSVIWTLIGFICVCIGIYWSKLSKKYKKKYDESCDEDDEFCRSVFIFLMIVFCIFGLLTIINQLSNIVTCYTFPEKIFIEELSSIYSSVK